MMKLHPICLLIAATYATSSLAAPQWHPKSYSGGHQEKSAQHEYFETAPISKMIVSEFSEYEPVHPKEVMFPDGGLLTEYDHYVAPSNSTLISPTDTTADKITEIFNDFDNVMLIAGDSYWVRDVSLPAAGPCNQHKMFSITSHATYPSYLVVNGESITVTKGSRLTYLSDGQKWVQVASAGNVARPKHFGVPVVTIVGFYDPDNQLESYIYPALHSSSGYVFP